MLAPVLLYIAVMLSFGAVNALIPIMIIVILIAAAAGLMRGYDLFAILGIGTLVGAGSMAKKGSVLSRSAYAATAKTMNINKQVPQIGGKLGKYVKGRKDVKAEKGQLTKDIKNKSGTDTYNKMLTNKANIENKRQAQENRLEKGNFGARQLISGIATGSVTTGKGTKVTGRVNLIKSKLSTDIATGKIDLQIGGRSVFKNKKVINFEEQLGKNDTDILTLSAAGIITPQLLNNQKSLKVNELNKAKQDLKAIKVNTKNFSLKDYKKVKEATEKVNGLQAEVQKLERIEDAGKKLNEDINNGVPVETAVSRFYDRTHGYSSQTNMIKYAALGVGAALTLNSDEAKKQVANLKEEWNQSPRLMNIIAAAVKGGPEGRGAALYDQYIKEMSKRKQVKITEEESIPIIEENKAPKAPTIVKKKE
ncbi:MAG: hypothetical protein QW257_00640 [Candidatus Micrarchaeaceae archaeon]